MSSLQVPALDSLSAEEIDRLYTEVAALGAALWVRIVTQRPAPQPDRAEVDVLSVAGLAARWGMTPAKVRELCRSGRIPARKLGPKEWIIPAAELKEWVRQNPRATQGALGYDASRETGPRQGNSLATRPHRVEVRRTARRASGDGSGMRVRLSDRTPPGGAPDAAPPREQARR